MVAEDRRQLSLCQPKAAPVFKSGRGRQGRGAMGELRDGSGVTRAYRSSRAAKVKGRDALTSSLRAQRSNPGCLDGKTLDCFVARAPRNDAEKVYPNR